MVDMNLSIDLQKVRKELYSAVICDALDELGYRNQSPRIQFHSYTGSNMLVGRCKNTLWADMYHEDPKPYELELQAVDNCKPGDVLVAAASGSVRSGIWGELLSTAASNRGCVGALIHGAVRDIGKMTDMDFPVFATANSPYDSLNRQRVVDIDLPVGIGGVIVSPDDLVICDKDGVVFVPKSIETEVLEKAFKKVNAENITRDEIKNGMKATEAYKKYGVL